MAGKIVYKLMIHNTDIARLEQARIVSVYRIPGTDDCLVAAKGVNKRSLKKIANSVVGSSNN